MEFRDVAAYQKDENPLPRYESITQEEIVLLLLLVIP